MVDTKKLSLVNGVDIAAFSKEVQEYLLKYINERGGISPTEYPASKRERIIIELLTKWKAEQEGN